MILQHIVARDKHRNYQNTMILHPRDRARVIQYIPLIWEEEQGR